MWRVLAVEKADHKGEVLICWTGDRIARAVRLGCGRWLQVSLRAAECDIVVVAPVINCGSAAVAPIGFPKMLNAGGAVRSVAVGKGGSCAVEVRGTGRLLVWADQRPRSVAAGRKALQFAYDCPACRLEIEVPETGPLDSVLNIAF